MANVRQSQEFEEEQLRSICRDSDILFLTIEPEMLNQTKAIAQLLRDAARHNETTNGASINSTLDGILQSRPMRVVRTMLALDANKTLAPYDASTLYWRLSGVGSNSLKDLFKSPPGHSYTAFRQMTWLYEQHREADSTGTFDRICENAVSLIKVHPQILAVLQRACHTGKGMVEFVRHIREDLSGRVRIVMVAGLVQEEVVGKDGMEGVFARELAGVGDMTLVTLRVLKNEHTGTGGTDMGHRLFDSTHLT